MAGLSALLATPPAPTPDSNIKWRAKDFGATIWPSAYDIMYRILQLSFTTFYAALVNWLLRHSSPPYFRFWVRLPAVVLYGLFGIFRLTGPKRQPLPCTDDFHEVMFGLPIPEARHRDVVLAFGACMVALAATLLVWPAPWVADALFGLTLLLVPVHINMWWRGHPFMHVYMKGGWTNGPKGRTFNPGSEYAVFALLQLVALGYLKLLARLLDPACSDVLPPSVFCDLR